MSKRFGEDSVKVFLGKVSEMMAMFSEKPPHGVNPYPVDCWFHVAGGVGGQDFHFVVSVLLVTDKAVADDFGFTLEGFAAKIGQPVYDFKLKEIKDDASGSR